MLNSLSIPNLVPPKSEEDFPDDFFRKVVDGTIGPFSISSEKGTVYSNDAMARLVGLQTKKDVARASVVIIDDTDPEEIRRAFKRFTRALDRLFSS